MQTKTKRKKIFGTKEKMKKIRGKNLSAARFHNFYYALPMRNDLFDVVITQIQPKAF